MDQKITYKENFLPHHRFDSFWLLNKIYQTIKLVLFTVLYGPNSQFNFDFFCSTCSYEYVQCLNCIYNNCIIYCCTCAQYWQWDRCDVVDSPPPPSHSWPSAFPHWYTWPEAQNMAIVPRDVLTICILSPFTLSWPLLLHYF